MEGKYSIELFRERSAGGDPEAVLARHDNFKFACALYRVAVKNHEGRLIMLCDRARVVARSDRPETMPK
jgi:hypothetical protein